MINCYIYIFFFFFGILLVIEELGHADRISNATPLLDQRPEIWCTFLLKVYYSTIKWMNVHKFAEIRNCRVDSDWEYVRIDFTSWINILDMCMVETICEKRIRKRKRDLLQLHITVLKMIIVVSELFCLLGQYVIQYDKNEKDESLLYINFKNHFHPDNIYKSEEFIWFVYSILQHKKFKFCGKLLPSDAPNSIVIFDDLMRTNYLPSKWHIVPMRGV